MVHWKQEDVAPATTEQVDELKRLVQSGGVSRTAMETLLQQAQEQSVAAAYRRRFHSVFCAKNRTDWRNDCEEFNAELFGEEIFGTPDEGEYVMARPHVGFSVAWDEDLIDAWHASEYVAGQGLEAGYLVDLAKYAADNPRVVGQPNRTVICWRAGKGGRLACLSKNGSVRRYCVRQRGYNWRYNTVFLLRKIRPQP